MLKDCENPPILFPDAETLAEWAGNWWVGHTKSRFEKAFAWDLLHGGIKYFLPMIEQVKISRGRKHRVLAPLFPSYVFFCGSDEDRYTAMTTNRLCQTINVTDQETLVGELSCLEKALAGQAVLDPYPFAAIGRHCRITAGPFQGMEGLVVERRQIARLVLQVSILGQGASMEIDAALLEPV